MMRFLLSYWIQIAAYFLAVCTLYSEQRQRERRWDDDIGMPLDPPPPWLKDEIHEENEELEELFFYKRSYAQFIEGMKGGFQKHNLLTNMHLHTYNREIIKKLILLNYNIFRT